VPLQQQRQAGATGVPETLLGPEAPSRQRCRAGERRAAEQKVASFQG